MAALQQARKQGLVRLQAHRAGVGTVAIRARINMRIYSASADLQAARRAPERGACTMAVPRQKADDLTATVEAMATEWMTKI